MLIKRATPKRNKKRRFLLPSLLILFTLLVVLYIGGSVFLKKRGFPEPFVYSLITARNYFSSFFASPEVLRIDIQKKDWNKLKLLREKNLERGLIFNEEGSFIPATLESEGKTIEIKLRLKGHMTDHIDGDKWSFRIMVKGNERYQGMRVFSIQHPGTRAYAYEWVYHQLMREEQIIALRYKFVRVVLNGEDKGIYCVEENFDLDLLENNKRVAGPILRFDPDLYWVDRYNEFIGDRVVAEYSTFSSSVAEPYRSKKILGDTVLKAQFEKASNMLETFRREKVKASEIFDVERLARFHAIIDLIGGHHSLDWSDVKYYFNPVKAKLEPIAYESFSVNPVRQLAGSYKFKTDRNSEADLHEILFSDPEFFSAYIRNVERISKPEFLDEFFKRNKSSLNENLKILYKEFPYKIFERKLYYRNQESIRKILDAPKGFHAWATIEKDSLLHFTAQSIEALPLKLMSVNLNGKKYPLDLLLEPKKAYNNLGKFITVDVPIAISDSIRTCTVDYKILGSARIRSLNAFTYKPPIPDHSIAKTNSSINDLPFLDINESKKLITFKDGSVDIASDLVIPDSFTVIISRGTILRFSDNARIFSYSPLECKGDSATPVLFKGSPKNSGIIIFAEKPSVFSHCVFQDFSSPAESFSTLRGAITFYEASASFVNCVFKDLKGEDGLTFIRSEFNVANCKFSTMANDAIDASYSSGRVTGSTFTACNEDAIDIMNSSVSISDVLAENIGNKAFNFKSRSKASVRSVKFNDCYVAISAEDESEVSGSDVKINRSSVGIVSYINKSGFKGSSIVLDRVQILNSKHPAVKEKKSQLILNIKDRIENVDNAEKIIE